METALYWMWLADAVGSGCRYAGELLETCGHPRDLYTHLRAGGTPPACLSRPAVRKLKQEGPAPLAARLEGCRRAGIAVLTPESPDYPARLRALPDLPIVLYATGDTGCLNGRRYAGMVGTRRPTRYGATACHDLARALAEAGVVVVSGLADGLDGEGHRAAVEAGQATIAFLGTPIDKTFPAANAGLRARMQALGGAVLSEYPPGYVGRTNSTFLARNRLIAGLSELLCVAEARERSGTFNTVGHAERYGRPVYAVPGSIYSPTSAGTNALLRDHRAEAICTAGDLLGALGLTGAQTPAPEAAFSPRDLSADARAVLAVLGPTPCTPEQAAAAAALPLARTLAALTELELVGAATPEPGHRYVAAG